MGIEIGIGFIVSAFIAGLLTFLAPCTLPLVPAYLSFISGVSDKDLKNPETYSRARRQVIKNGVFFIGGFSAVFIIFGTLAGVLGAGLVGYRVAFTTIGGLLVVLFGLIMLGTINLSIFTRGQGVLRIPSFMRKGNVSSSFLVGSAFAFGWTPCVGPILGSILLLASTEGSVITGALLLAVFSLGLAVPFMLIAFGIGSATEKITGLFEWLERRRATLLTVVGFVVGFFFNLSLVALVQLADIDGRAFFAEGLSSFIVPIIFAFIIPRLFRLRPHLDVLSITGGLFLVSLGLLLATGKFSLLIEYGFEFFGFLEYDALLDLL